MISVTIGRLPAMNTTAPNSPSDRANAIVTPARNAGRISGQITSAKTCHGRAPRLCAASSISAEMSSSTGWTVRTTKGIEVKTLERPTEILAEVVGPRPLAVLSGPSHAEEVARGLPCAVVAASRSAA